MPLIIIIMLILAVISIIPLDARRKRFFIVATATLFYFIFYVLYEVLLNRYYPPHTVPIRVDLMFLLPLNFYMLTIATSKMIIGIMSRYNNKSYILLQLTTYTIEAGLIILLAMFWIRS